MIRSIKNPFLTVTVKGHGAELCSIRSSKGMEYMWQGDPSIWGRQAPVLFPVVGKVANDSYIHEGKRYKLNQHGFARDMDFEIAEESADSLSFLLLPTPETRERYPFEFSLLVRYRLMGNCLEIGCEVANNSPGIMPFSIGAHPAFALTWGKDDRIEDYFLEFEEAETLDAYLLGKGNLISSEKVRVMTNERILPIRRETFDRDALIFLALKSEKVALGSHRRRNRLTVEFKGFPYLGIWAKPAAPFVCIEPWLGHADMEETDGILMNKPGIIKLAPGKSFTCTHMIVIDE